MYEMKKLLCQNVLKRLNPFSTKFLDLLQKVLCVDVFMCVHLGPWCNWLTNFTYRVTVSPIQRNKLDKLFTTWIWQVIFLDIKKCGFCLKISKSQQTCYSVVEIGIPPSTCFFPFPFSPTQYFPYMWLQQSPLATVTINNNRNIQQLWSLLKLRIVLMMLQSFFFLC